MNLTPPPPLTTTTPNRGRSSNYREESWAALSDSTEIDIDEGHLDHIRGLGDLVTATSSRCTLTQLIHLALHAHGRPLRHLSITSSNCPATV